MTIHETRDSRPFKDLFGGPMGGSGVPVHGGHPDAAGCGGCTDCCHLPEISVTAAEADMLVALSERVGLGARELVISRDLERPDWRIMKGPCPFHSGIGAGNGGCRIYEDRPGSCRVFTCAFLLNLRRSQNEG